MSFKNYLVPDAIGSLDVDLEPFSEQIVEDLVAKFTEAYITSKKANPLFLAVGYSAKDFSEQVRKNILIARPYWEDFSLAGRSRETGQIVLGVYCCDITNLEYLRRNDLPPLAHAGMDLKRQIDKRMLLPLYERSQGKAGVVMYSAQGFNLSQEAKTAVSNILIELGCRAYIKGYQYFGGMSFTHHLPEFVYKVWKLEKFVELDLGKEYTQQLPGYKGRALSVAFVMQEDLLREMVPQHFDALQQMRAVRL